MAKRPSKEIENDFTDFVENQSRNERKIIEAHIPTNLTEKLVAKNESQKQLIKSIKNNDITICSGQAGSGKTYLSVGYALNLIRKSSTNYKKIYFVKSVIPLRGEEIGFLKGDYMEKIEPYMQSFYMNLEKFISKQSINVLLGEEIIKPFPVAFMRGVTIDDSIVIVDEAQNLQLTNIQTIMTRIASSSKMIILGDTKQIDLKNKSESSLEHLLSLFDGSVKGINVVRMNDSDDNIRNPIIKDIERIFDTHNNNKKDINYEK